MQDLGFPQDERIEARRDPEGVADRVFFFMVVEFILKQRERGLGPLGEQLGDDDLGLLGVFGNGVDLDPVTGRQHQPLADRGLLPQPLEDRREPRLGQVQPFADLDRGRGVVEAHRQDHHDSRYPLPSSRSTVWAL